MARRFVGTIGVACAAVCVVALVGACRSGAGGTASTNAAASAGAASALPPPAGNAADPVAALAQLDGRQPVPLLPMMANHQKMNMRDHLLAVQQIIAGLAVEDFGAIEAAGKRLGFSEQMGAMCNHMGAMAPGFAERALAFHHTADGIGEAARKKDAKAVMEALSATLATCTTCHEGFQQKVIDASQWTGAPMGMGMMRGGGPGRGAGPMGSMRPMRPMGPMGPRSGAGGGPGGPPAP